MIKCKEDLINTYIENDFGELRDLYVKKAIELGFAHQGYVDRKCDWYNLNFVGICNGWSSVRLGQTNDASEELKKHECRELTLSDLKPKRTRTEYEKVTESIFDLRDEFERGELYTKGRGAGGDFFKKITTECELITFASCGLYRKVEKEIDWREGVMKYLFEHDYHNSRIATNDWVEIKQSFKNDEFLEMCRVALRANGELD